MAITQGSRKPGLAGAQVDATLGKLDLRGAICPTRLPSIRRSVFATDQYGNWAGGAGYTIKQGFRGVGVSAFNGPYLSRNYPFFFPGEAPPIDLPGSAYGVDVKWGRGPWNVYGEWQRFQMDYRVIPTYRERTGYGEVRRTLSPRWYLATRISYLRSSFPGYQAYEFVAGFRPDRYQLIKAGYETRRGPGEGTPYNVFTVQLVTAFTPISLTGR